MIDESEVIRRLTFCQDTDPNACAFRIARLRLCDILWGILHTSEHLPPALRDLQEGFHFQWSADFPHHNVISAKGRATVIYMGEGSSMEQIEQTFKTIAECLHKISGDSVESRFARQRLAIWFREKDKLLLWDPYRYVNIADTGDASEYDIGREK
jgi:hypothetical protein